MTVAACAVILGACKPSAQESAPAESARFIKALRSAPLANESDAFKSVVRALNYDSDSPSCPGRGLCASAEVDGQDRNISFFRNHR